MRRDLAEMRGGDRAGNSFLESDVAARPPDLRRSRGTATVRNVDQIWTDYYDKFPIPQWVANRLSATAIRVLVNSGMVPVDPSVVEIGGGNSHFAPWFFAAWPRTTRYVALDINDRGLATVPRGVTPMRCDILSDDLPSLVANVVASTGVVQYFSPVDTKRAIDAHFALVKPGGLVLITFPRDTPVYWVCRAIFTWLGLFPRDLYERPLTEREVVALVANQGAQIGAATVWSIGFAHTFMLFKARI